MGRRRKRDRERPVGGKGRRVIPYDCDPAPICTGPAPFDADVAPCCDEHEEEWTRGKARLECDWPWSWMAGDFLPVRTIANHAGVHQDDFVRFLTGEASLTYPARLRIRGCWRESARRHGNHW